MKQFTVFIGRVKSDLPPSTLLQKYNLPPSTIKPQDTPLIYSIQTLNPLIPCFRWFRAELSWHYLFSYKPCFWHILCSHKEQIPVCHYNVNLVLLRLILLVPCPCFCFFFFFWHRPHCTNNIYDRKQLIYISVKTLGVSANNWFIWQKTTINFFSSRTWGVLLLYCMATFWCFDLLTVYVLRCMSQSLKCTKLWVPKTTRCHLGEMAQVKNKCLHQAKFARFSGLSRQLSSKPPKTGYEGGLIVRIELMRGVFCLVS